MLKPIKIDIKNALNRLNISELIEENKTLKKTERALEELIEKGQARPVSYKKGILLIQCKNSATAHYLKTNEKRIKIVANADKVRYMS